MTGIHPLLQSTYGLVALLALATTSNAENLGDWYCPYRTDGACAPKRQTYGYFAPKWRRWPGVTNADYQSKRPPQELPKPPAATEEPGLPPGELLLPPTDFPRDDAPAPPGGAGEPQPLTPETEPRPDILSPPGEDVMDELLPDVEQPNRPTQRPSAPSDNTEIPFPEANESTDPAPAPTEPEPARRESAEPKSAPPAPLQPTDDPFKDDPFFDDAAPKPRQGTRPTRLNWDQEAPPQSVPATHEAPARLPAAQLERTPQSRLSRTPGSGEPTLAKPRLSAARPERRSNPLRSGTTPEMASEDRVIPTAAWQTDADVAPPTALGNNPLR